MRGAMTCRPTRCAVTLLAALCALNLADTQGERSRATLAVSHTVLVEAIANGTPACVTDIIAGDHPGELTVVTQTDIRSIGADGVVHRIVPFPEWVWRPAAIRLEPGGGTQFIGVTGYPRLFARRGHVVVFDADGQPVASCVSQIQALVMTADVEGDERQELIVRASDGVAIHDVGGERVAFLRAPRYLDHVQVIDRAGGKAAILLYMYESARKGARYLVLDASGGVVADWHDARDHRVWPWVWAWNGKLPVVWTASGDEITAAAVGGAVVERYAAPGAGTFKYFFGGELRGGRKVLIGSAGGSLVRSAIYVYGPDHALAHSETLATRVSALYTPDEDGTVFFVGTDDQVLRYEVVRLPAGAGR